MTREDTQPMIWKNQDGGWIASINNGKYRIDQREPLRNPHVTRICYEASHQSPTAPSWEWRDVGIVDTLEEAKAACEADQNKKRLEFT